MKQKRKNNLIWSGTIVNTHGIKGEVRIIVNDNFTLKSFPEGKEIYFYENEVVKKLKITSSRQHKKFVLLTFENIININDIEWIKNTKIYVDRYEDEKDYYLSDLIGVSVMNADKEVIGEVTTYIDQGSYHSLIVLLKNGKETNIPMVDEFKVEYNMDKNIINVNIPKEFIE